VAVAERAVYSDYTTRRDQASTIISGSCCNEVQIQIEEIDDPAEMWTTIARKIDATSTVVGRITLLRKFHTFRLVAGESINTYFSRLMCQTGAVWVPESLVESRVRRVIEDVSNVEME
jgi:hypothetical protein